MSVVCILTPVVIASWPAFSAALVAAASSLGYTTAEAGLRQISGTNESVSASRSIKLEIPQSELVTQQLGRDQRMSVTREGVTITFSRNARGQAELCVSGGGHTDEMLRAMGEELSQRVVQKYVHQRMMEEMRQKGFVVVEETTDANQAIHIRVRHWEN